MKIHIYHRNYQRVFQICLLLLKDMGYKINFKDEVLGQINAYKSGQQTRLMDLRIQNSYPSVMLFIMPGLMTGDCLNISYDEKISGEFTESFLEYMKENDNIIDDFRLNTRKKLAREQLSWSYDSFGSVAQL